MRVSEIQPTAASALAEEVHRCLAAQKDAIVQPIEEWEDKADMASATITRRQGEAEVF